MSLWLRICALMPVHSPAFAVTATIFAATSATARANPDDQKERFVAKIEVAGCIVNEQNAAILVEAGLTPEQVSVIVNQMMDVGEAEPFGNDLRLKTAGCQ